MPTLLEINRLGLPHSSAFVSEVATLNRKRTTDARFGRIEFEGRFVVANTQRPVISGLPTGVDGAEKISAIATSERFVALAVQLSSDPTPASREVMMALHNVPWRIIPHFGT